MNVAIMQPYFLPYIGYFQLLSQADVFVVYDNLKYTKKGWINRNRMLLNGHEAVFSVPLRAAPDDHAIQDRELADDFDRAHLLARLLGAYARAPFLAGTRPLLERIVHCPASGLFDYLFHSLNLMADHLAITTPMVRSSTLPIDHGLRGQDKVLAICAALGASTYTNPPGGVELYSRETFAARGLRLQFLRPVPFSYAQTAEVFVPWLSIVDVLMFNPLESVRARVREGHELF